MCKSWNKVIGNKSWFTVNPSKESVNTPFPGKVDAKSPVSNDDVLEITAISVRGLTDPTVENTDQSCYWRYLSFLCNETVLISTKLAQVFVHSKKNFDVKNSSSLAWHHKFSDWATDQELEQCKIFIFIFFRLSDNNALGSFFSLMEQFSRWNIYRQETFHHFTEKYPDIVSTDSDEETVLLLQNPQISER